MNSKNSFRTSKELQELIEIHGISLLVCFLKTFNCLYIDTWESKVDEFYKLVVNVYYREEKENDHRIVLIVNGDTRISMWESSVQEITRDFKRFSSLKAFI